MSKAHFSVGDVVVLKSGGPRMTIQRIYEIGTADYVWDEVDVVWFTNAWFNTARVAVFTLNHWREEDARTPAPAISISERS